MEVLAIIPARGGSKAIPHKNLAPLCGRPLIVWMIEAAKSSCHIDRVIVSTDDADIGQVAEAHGAEVIWRPAAFSGDFDSSELALLHVLETLKESENYQPDLTVFLQCTAPLTTGGDIDDVVHSLLLEESDSAPAVTHFHEFVWKQHDGDGVGVNHDKSKRLMRQQLDPTYVECGSVYVMKTDGFRTHRHRFFGRTSMFVVPRDRHWDINDPIDLEVAQVMLAKQLRERKRSLIPENLKAIAFDGNRLLTDDVLSGVSHADADLMDGLDLKQLRSLGLELLVLLPEQNPIVSELCRELGVDVIDKSKVNSPTLLEWLSENDISPEQAAYFGNGHDDLDCLTRVGCGLAAADALPDAKAVASVVLNASAGQGAVREICELLLHRITDSHSVSRSRSRIDKCR